MRFGNIGAVVMSALFSLYKPFFAGKNKQANSSKVRAEKETVILLHGLGRTALSMVFLEKRLLFGGYRVVNVDYPSTKLDIENIAEKYVAPLVQKHSATSGKIHFVTHSMGGIVVRQYLERYSPDNIGRIVMLAPPNRGSEIIDNLQNSSFFRKMMGPASLQLSTAPTSLPNSLGEISSPTGIIAGDVSLNPVSSFLVRGSDDGKVSVASTHLAGMRDHIVIHSSHTFIMLRPNTIEQVVYFLKNGHFRH